MANIINLRRFKKTKAREEEAKQADANRVKFGQSKALRELSKAEASLQTSKLDGHKRDD
jgi:hypothetical protein